LSDITNLAPRVLDLGQGPRRTISNPIPFTTPEKSTAESIPVYMMDTPPPRPANSPLTKIERIAAVVLKLDGQSTSVVAAKLNISQPTVNKWAERWQEGYDIEDDYRSGRPKILSENRLDDILDEAIAKPKESTPGELLFKLNLPCSKKTVRRVLDENGLFGRISRKIPLLQEVHIKQRISFAEGYKDHDWSITLWSDEMSICLGPQGQIWVQRPIGETFNPVYCTETVKHPTKVHVWGCFCQYGVGEVYVFTENLDAAGMVEILRKCLIKSANTYWKNKTWWFQQDNDPKHTSRLVRDFLFQKGIQLLEWPPYSPDLNPIENLWSDLKKRVGKTRATNQAELSAAVKKAWKESSQELCEKLVKSVPNRLQIVLEQSGGPSGY